MFGYNPYSYGRPAGYYSAPSTVGYPYNYARGYDDSEYARQIELLRRRQMYEEEMERRRQLAMRQRWEEEERLREQEEERRRNEAYRRFFGSTRPPFEADDERTATSSWAPKKVQIRSRSNSPAPKAETATEPQTLATSTTATTTEPETVTAETTTAAEEPAAPTAPAEEVPSEKLDEAATRIQQAYRRHRALASINSKHAEFLKLVEGFQMPTTLDFDYSGKVTVPVAPPAEGTDEAAGPSTASEPMTRAKLAYTPNNAPLHYHVEQLNRLLIALDGVESYGDAEVRRRRKQVVGEIEAEVERIEGIWRGAWDRFSTKSVTLTA